MERKSKIRSIKGQTLVEFLLVIMIILTLLFMFVQLAWSLAWGHYVHYATFMAARAYFAANDTKALQLDNASEVLRAMVKSPGTDKDLFNRLIPSRNGDRRDITGDEPVPGAFIGAHPKALEGGLTERAYSWAEGVQYNFEFKLFLFPFATWLKKDIGKKITMGPRGEESAVAWDGKIGLASDAFLGREVSVQECRDFMRELAQVIPRSDGEDFLFDNGC